MIQTPSSRYAKVRWWRQRSLQAFSTVASSNACSTSRRRSFDVSCATKSCATKGFDQRRTVGALGRLPHPICRHAAAVHGPCGHAKRLEFARCPHRVCPFHDEEPSLSELSYDRSSYLARCKSQQLRAHVTQAANITYLVS